MSALASLVRAYDRLAERGEVPPFGYSLQNIGFVISLDKDGAPAGKPIDLRSGNGKKREPRIMAVPQPVKRTSGIAPNFLWDKSSYVLGVTAGAGKRLADEHAAFAEMHRAALEETKDEGLAAILKFLGHWTPEKFVELEWPDEMKDQNVVFALERERLANVMVHDRPEAQTLWARLSAEGEKFESVCLVTGERSPISRLHPSIKGVWGAQTAGASIVSFNLDAFSSFGKDQGFNAPTSERAAAAYTTMLNRYLAKGSRHRIQIGDASTVFWADASDTEDAEMAQDIFAAFFAIDEEVESAKVGAILEKIRAGRPAADIQPDLPKEGVRFYVLGLSPNAARISVRFYLEDDFGEIARRYLAHLERMRIDPPPKDAMPSMWRLLIETAVLRKSENIQPNLAGEWMRAILTGAPYPRSLLSSVIMRLRADHDVNALRVAILKSVLLSHNPERKAPVSLDPDCRDRGYLLGQLFAIYEQVQSAALGGVNASITDKFYGAASAQPRRVFHLLDKNAKPHLAKIGKEKPGYRINLEKQIGAIMEGMSPGDDPFPAQLATESQALFALGYYHQRNKFFRGKDKPDAAAIGEEAAS
jgi:CRISPR-associated protein Csd1